MQGILKNSTPSVLIVSVLIAFGVLIIDIKYFSYSASYLAIRKVHQHQQIDILNNMLPSIVVSCIEEHALSSNKSLRQLTFMGDSRMRQHFYSFLRILPDYDRIWDGEVDQRMPSQFDMDVTSPLLNLHVAFRWRPLASEDVIKEIIKNWTAPLPSQTEKLPFVLLIGMNVWHHLRFAGDEDPSYQVYAKNVKLIAPLLQQLTLKGVYVVWMINQPTFDFAYFLKRAEDIEEIFIHNEKVFQFNRVARAILSKEAPSVKLFYPTESIAMEYLRSCGRNQRVDVWQYYRCLDWVHLGNRVIHENTRNLIETLLCPFIIINNYTNYNPSGV